MQCMREGCADAATTRLGFKVWAKGHPTTSAPVLGSLGLTLCQAHAWACDPAEFFGPAQTAAIDRALLGQDKAPGNWPGAMLTFTAIEAV